MHNASVQQIQTLGVAQYNAYSFTAKVKTHYIMALPTSPQTSTIGQPPLPHFTDQLKQPDHLLARFHLTISTYLLEKEAH